MYSRLNNESFSNETSDDENTKETTYQLTSTPVSAESYGSTPVRDQPFLWLYIPWCAVVYYVMAFFGFFCAMLIRQGLSVAIVAMVNQTAVAGDTTVTNVSEDECPRDPELIHEGGEFNWDRNQQGVVLAAFFYGHGVLQVPGGWMADRFGGKWLYGGAVLTLSVVSLLTPAAARTHIGVLIALQVLSGVGKGVMMPSSHALIARWSAPQYRSTVANVIFLGIDVGVTAGMFLAGVLCDYGFAGGWPSVFYVVGVIGCVWSAAWFLLCYDSPATKPRITAAERRYWETTIGITDLETHPPTPWREILTSVPVWALAVLHCADVWGYLTLMVCLPLYMHDVLGVNTTKNGAFSALPFAVSLVAGPASGLFADWLRTRLSTTVVRKLICFVAYSLIICLLILVGYIGCDRALAVAIICVITSCAAVGFSVVGVNQLDLAPLHAGKIIGLTYTIANLGAIAAPHVVGAITYERSTRSEWRNVFFIMAANYVVGMVVFVIFGSGERQSWADGTSRDQLRD